MCFWRRREPTTTSAALNSEISSNKLRRLSCPILYQYSAPERSIAGQFQKIVNFCLEEIDRSVIRWNQHKGRVAKLVDASDSKSDTERYESSILSPPTARKASDVLTKRSVLNSQALPTASLITWSRTRWWLSLLAEYFPKISWNNWWPTALLLSSAFLCNKNRKRWVIRQAIYLLWI